MSERSWSRYLPWGLTALGLALVVMFQAISFTTWRGYPGLWPSLTTSLGFFALPWYPFLWLPRMRTRLVPLVIAVACLAVIAWVNIAFLRVPSWESDGLEGFFFVYGFAINGFLVTIGFWVDAHLSEKHSRKRQLIEKPAGPAELLG